MGLATLLIYPLSQLAPVVSLSVVYLPAVVVVSAYWGLRLGLVTAVGSAAAFNFFHLPPVGTFELGDRRDWAALAAFVVVAVTTGLIAELARTRVGRRMSRAAADSPLSSRSCYRRSAADERAWPGGRF